MEKDMEWEINPKKKVVYFIEDGKKYQVKTFAVLANGVGDLCFARSKDAKDINDNDVMTIENAKKTGAVILGYPSADVAAVEFYDRKPPCLFFQIEPEHKSMIAAILKILPPSHIGKDWEMFAGDSYT
jgi:hypothetical protein